MDVNIPSTSNIMKRNSSPLRHMNNCKVKKCMTSNDISSKVSNVQKHIFLFIK